MKLVDALELPMGVIEVETKTVFSIWSILTLGLIRKIESRFKSSFCDRYWQLKSQHGFDNNPMEKWWDEITVRHATYLSVKHLHEEAVNYAYLAGCLTCEEIKSLQRFMAVKEAISQGDVDTAFKLALEVDPDWEDNLRRELQNRPR